MTLLKKWLTKSLISLRGCSHRGPIMHIFWNISKSSFTLHYMLTLLKLSLKNYHITLYAFLKILLNSHYITCSYFWSYASRIFILHYMFIFSWAMLKILSHYITCSFFWAFVYGTFTLHANLSSIFILHYMLIFLGICLSWYFQITC